MHKGLKEPHLFNAGSNPFKLIRNLAGILVDAELDKIRAEVNKNVISLFRLGEAHYIFAKGLPLQEWRQRTSRLYYGAYNVRRAVTLKNDGSFSSDSSDHKDVDSIPDLIANAATYKQKLKDLREDRNLADYSHLAVSSDLLIPISESENLVTTFIKDCREFLALKG